jgi:hypothetical protein
MLGEPFMKSAEFEHGPYVIKTFARDGEVRGRVFLDGSWMRAIPDWVAGTPEETVAHIRRFIDEMEEEDMEQAEPALH